MTKYARLHTSLQVSSGADYRGGRMVGHEQTETPDEYVVDMVVDANATGATVDLGNYDTVTAVVLHNSSTTDAWAKSWMNLFSTSGTNFTIADASPADILTDAEGDSLFTSWPSGCWVRYTGATITTRYLVQSVSANALTYVNSTDLAADAGTALSLSVYCDTLNYVHVPAGTTVVLQGIRTADDITVYTASGTAAISVSVLGT